MKFVKFDASAPDLAGHDSVKSPRFPEFCNCSLEKIAARATTVTTVLNEILRAKGFVRTISLSPGQPKSSRPLRDQ
jgi:hypothetical protein